MSTKAKYRNGIEQRYESTTHETVLALAPVTFVDDFLGKAIDTTHVWTSHDTSAAGDAAPALVADAANGVLALALDNTNEAQLSGVSWGDNRTLVLNQGLVFEARFRYSTLLTGAAIGVIGLAGDHNATFDSVAESIVFRADGSGAITVETDDGTNETSQVSTGTTLTTSDWIIARIECDDPTSVRFYINGEQVATGTTFNMNATPTLALQPYARVSKGAATSVGTMQIDYIRCWQKRS